MKERFNDLKKQRLDVVMGFPRRFFSQFLPQRRCWFFVQSSSSGTKYFQPNRYFAGLVLFVLLRPLTRWI